MRSCSSQSAPDLRSIKRPAERARSCCRAQLKADPAGQKNDLTVTVFQQGAQDRPLLWRNADLEKEAERASTLAQMGFTLGIASVASIQSGRNESGARRSAKSA